MVVKGYDSDLYRGVPRRTRCRRLLPRCDCVSPPKDPDFGELQSLQAENRQVIPFDSNCSQLTHVAPTIRMQRRDAAVSPPLRLKGPCYSSF